jgi:ligand-binding sensor domain-containing protein
MLNKIISIAFYVCFMILVLSAGAFSQTTYNGWNIYTSFREVKGVGVGQNTVWAASSGGLFNFDQNSLTGINKFTTLDGLLSNELTSIIVSSDGKVWSGSFDGSISVLNTGDNTWRQITDIKTSTEPSKRVNAFYQYNNLMFFATEFCIVKFSIPQFQFVDQPYIFLGPSLPIKSPVNDILVVNDTIWAATKNGIAYANINSNLPIQSSWRNYTTINSVLKRNLINSVAYFDSKVIMGTDSGMVYFQNGSLNTYDPLYNGQPLDDGIYRMAVSNGTFYFSTYSYEGTTRGNFRIFRVNQSNINNAELLLSGIEVNSLKVNSIGDLLIGTVSNGVNVYRNNASNNVIPNGPYSNLNFNIAVEQNKNLWAVSGSLGDWVNRSGIYKYDGNNWFNYTFSEFPVMGNGCCGWVFTYPDRIGNVWVAGFGNGLLKINGTDLIRYTDANSILQPLGGPGFVLINGIDEDNSGNLWVLNNRVQNNFINFTQGVGYPTAVGDPFGLHGTFMVIDNFNTKWVTLHPIEGSLRGVVYFNENTSPGGALISYQLLGSDITQVNDIVVDKNGEVWIATNNGVVIIANPEQVINNPGSIPTTFKMRIIENGISTPLTENVLSIDVDALNNKWLGTISNGVIYVSPDGSTLLNRFNQSNSPLLDNKITSIRADKNSGKVYFGSDKGMVSYQTIAVNPLTDCDKISAGPNPFVVPSSSQLRIDGLVEESTVKILSISGTLVAEFETPGGKIANWDGRDLNGNYVASGIYIIAGFNKDGSKVCKGKVAIVRK